MNKHKKKILFIGVGFFQYDKYIIEALKNIGYEVFYFRMGKTWLDRCTGNFLLKYKNFRLRKYLRYKQFDTIICIKGNFLDRQTLSIIQSLPVNKSLYLWDSVIRDSNAKIIHIYFDNVFSFDRKDCEAYSFRLLPLFYIDRKNKFPVAVNKKRIFFLGTSHSVRMDKILVLAESLSLEFTLDINLVVSKLNWLSKLGRGKYITCRRWSYMKYLNHLTQADIIIDVNHPDQSGLTMRTIEALGMGKNLITTNPEIKNYYFYEPERILIWDREITAQVVKNKFLSDPTFPKDEMRKDISLLNLKNWVKYLTLDEPLPEFLLSNDLSAV
tara:strand:+ start:460 stop:1440 length:981 start_codon:yes stop_codon:yes gene_type:complete